MNFKKLLYTSFLSISFISSYSQRDYVWELGHFFNPVYPKFGINFQSGSPDTFSVFRDMPFFENNASICDTNGGLLFYTNGIYVANSLHDTLLNSIGFNPGSATTIFSSEGINMSQACVIMPLPASDSLYNIFHESAEFFTAYGIGEEQPLNLRYSMVDMSLDNNKGGIIPSRKNLIIINDTLTYGKIAACKHGNGRDWWVIAHRFHSDIFYKLLITPDTIEVSSQQIGSLIIFDVLGQAVFSPDGMKYVLLTQNHLLDIYDFDRCSGMLSNPLNISVPDTVFGVVGCSISPDNRFIYAGNQVRVYQYDLASANVATSVITVAYWDTVASPFATLFNTHQLAPDGKIYIGTYNGCNVLHIIDEPDSLGIACNIIQNSLKLPGYNISLPNFPNYNLGPLTGSACDTLTSVSALVQNAPLQLKVFPNPIIATDVFINYSLEQNKTGLLQILNTTGQVIYKQRLPQWSSYQHIYLPKLSNGVYLVRLSSGAKMVSKKIVKMEE